MKLGSHECAGPVSSIVANGGRDQDLYFLTNEIDKEKETRHRAIAMKKNTPESVLKK